MTTAKKFLQSIRDGLIEIRMHEENIARLRASLLPQSVVPDKINVQSSTDPDKIGRIEAMIDDFERDLAKVVERHLTNYKIALVVINMMPKELERRVLISRYMGQNEKNAPKSWNEVCKELDLSKGYVKSLHKDGLESFEAMRGRLALGNARKV